MLSLLSIIVAFYQSQIQNRRRRGRNHVARECAHVTAADSVYVERWLIDQLHQTLSTTFGARQAELRLQFIVVRRRVGNRLSLGITKRLNSVVPTRDRYAA